MLQDTRPILVLAPHTDDGELGCGGTIARLCREGYSVYYVAFCSCDESLPPGVAKGTLRREVYAATHALGIPNHNVFVENFVVRRLSFSRQDVLDRLVELNKQLDPQLVFCPTSDDLHQDHATVAQEAMRAFKTRTLLGYEMPWNNLRFEADVLFRLSDQDIARKVAALAEYRSQLGRAYVNERFICALAHTRGVMVNAEYAEAFTLFRAVY